MRKEVIFGIAIEILGNGTGIGLQMAGYINPTLGWLIVGISNLAGFSLIIYGARKKDSKQQQATIAKREQAQEIHRTNKENWQENPELKKLMSQLQIELNSLGYIVNSREYDTWAEAMMLYYSKRLKFHMIPDGEMAEWGRARINKKLRIFTNKVKG